MRKLPDIFTKKKRSEIMSKIRSKDTKIELKMARMLRKAGISYERQPNLFGSPDFRLRENTRILIFCDGDFWHGYRYNPKKHRKRFWRDKIERNMARDRIVNSALRRSDHSVLRMWEHDINGNPEKCMRKIMRSMYPFG